MLSLAELRAQLGAAKTKAADQVAAATEIRKEEDLAAKAAREKRAAKMRTATFVETQYKRLLDEERAALLAEFGGDAKAAKEAAADLLGRLDEKQIKYWRWAGWNISVGLRLDRLVGIRQGLPEIEIQLAEFNRLGITGDAVATVEGLKTVAVAEIAELEKDAMVRFFSRVTGYEDLAGEAAIKAAVEAAVSDNHLELLATEVAKELREAQEKEGDDYHGRRVLSILSVKPLPGIDWKDLNNFRYYAAAEAEDRSRAARNRLVFFGLKQRWLDAQKARKEGREAFKRFLAKCLPLAEAAEGKAGVYLGQEVTREVPWKPMRKDTSGDLVPVTNRDGQALENYGVLVAVVETKGGWSPTIYFPVLNREVRVEGLEPVYVGSGLFMPLKVYGAWGEDPEALEPVRFRFEAGKAFAGLRPASQNIFLPKWQLLNLTALLQKAAGIQPPPKEEQSKAEAPTNPAQSPSQPRTKRGARADGSKAGETRRDRGKSGRPGGDEPPETPSRVQTLADAEESEE